MANTRNKTKSSLEELVGSGKNFLPSEVPTYRAVFQRGIILQQENAYKTSYKTSNLCHDLAEEIISQWQKSNALFRPPITIQSKSIQNKLIKKWERIRKVSDGRCSEEIAHDAINELDSVFDIIVCKHEIVLCDNDEQCNGCDYKAHIKCDCPLKVKIPKLELEWVFHQRTKITEKSSLQISTADKKETLRQENAQKNAEKRKKQAESSVHKDNAPTNLDASDTEEAINMLETPSDFVR